MKEKISAEERNPMKEKFTRDIFQEIADNRIQPGEAQREIPPAAKNGRCFEKCSRPFPYDEVSFRQEVPFQERQEAFKRELAALRERYGGLSSGAGGGEGSCRAYPFPFPISGEGGDFHTDEQGGCPLGRSDAA